ncbi:MAG: nucleoside hydrolase [Candidatus Ornithospirochaeta sp.]
MRHIILDVDTGHDDAVAIAIAAGLKDEIVIDGLIATAGNQVREYTLENTLNLAEALEIEAPVYAGSVAPLLRERVTAGNIHGKNGFEGPVFAPRKKKECMGNGVKWAVEHVISHPGEVTFVSVGPWTDLAVCLKSDERFASSLKEIVLMGGAVDHPGNVTESAEFNVFADPEAAAIVLKSGVPTTVFALDVTLKLQLTEEILDKVRKLPDSRYKEIFLASMGYYVPSLLRAHGEMPAMHDPCTIAYLYDPSIFTYSYRPISVETKGDKTYGKTVGGKEDKNSNIKMGIEVDNDKFWALFFKAVENLA